MDTNRKVKRYILKTGYAVDCISWNGIYSIEVIPLGLPFELSVESTTRITNPDSANREFKRLVQKYSN